MDKKYFVAVALAAIMAIPAITLADAAPATGGDDANGAVSNNTSVAPPATGGDNTNGAVSNNTSVAAPPTGGDDTNGAGSAPKTIPTPPATSGGGGGGGSYYGGSGTLLPVASSAPASVATVSTCPLIGSFMKYGENNNTLDVIKLQIFLSKELGINVGTTGVYDIATYNAVELFQSKYLNDVMLPWHWNYPTGYAYITTVRKINEISCQEAISLTPNEVSIINASVERISSINSTPASSPASENEIGSAVNNPSSASVVLAPAPESPARISLREWLVGNLSMFFSRIFNSIFKR